MIAHVYGCNNLTGSAVFFISLDFKQNAKENGRMRMNSSMSDVSKIFYLERIYATPKRNLLSKWATMQKTERGRYPGFRKGIFTYNYSVSLNERSFNPL
ncbi:MAG: hypothetical protein LUQ47_03525 [Methanotrichaceae archaeon]|nr:hypothetical protein [Methanotrichaceae archaeon]